MTINLAMEQFIPPGEMLEDALSTGLFRNFPRIYLRFTRPRIMSEMMLRWIWLVPSIIWVTLASRM
jgi:hypothetical protein